MAKISLRKVKKSDKKYFAVWWRDKLLLKLTSGEKKIISDDEVDKYFLNILTKKENFHYIILRDNKVIGHIALTKRSNGWHEVTIIIGKKSDWGRGYGTKAIQLLLNKAKKITIGNIYLEVRPTNERAIWAYKKCGFQPKGVKKHPGNKNLPATLKMTFYPLAKTGKRR